MRKLWKVAALAGTLLSGCQYVDYSKSELVISRQNASVVRVAAASTVTNVQEVCAREVTRTVPGWSASAYARLSGKLTSGMLRDPKTGALMNAMLLCLDKKGYKVDEVVGVLGRSSG